MNVDKKLSISEAREEIKKFNSAAESQGLPKMNEYTSSEDVDAAESLLQEAGLYNPVNPIENRVDSLVAEITASLNEYGDRYGIKGLEKRVGRGLDPAGMLAVPDIREKIEKIAQSLGANIEDVIVLTNKLHTGAIWEYSKDLNRAEKPDILTWIVMAQIVTEGREKGGDLTKKEFIDDLQRIIKLINRALEDPKSFSLLAKEKLISESEKKFQCSINGVPTSSSMDGFLAMAINGYESGIIEDKDKLLFVGAKELDFSFLQKAGLSLVEREDRGRMARFYRDMEGNDAIKELYPGLAIVFPSPQQKTIAELLAFTGTKEYRDLKEEIDYLLESHERVDDVPELDTEIDLTEVGDNKGLISTKIGEALDNNSFRADTRKYLRVNQEKIDAMTKELILLENELWERIHQIQQELLEKKKIELEQEFAHAQREYEKAERSLERQKKRKEGQPGFEYWLRRAEDWLSLGPFSKMQEAEKELSLIEAGLYSEQCEIQDMAKQQAEKEINYHKLSASLKSKKNFYEYLAKKATDKYREEKGLASFNEIEKAANTVVIVEKYEVYNYDLYDSWLEERKYLFVNNHDGTYFLIPAPESYNTHNHIYKRIRVNESLTLNPEDIMNAIKDRYEYDDKLQKLVRSDTMPYTPYTYYYIGCEIEKQPEKD